MNIARMEKFEALWSIRHDLPAESLVQYRFESREGYRKPELAAHYRTFVETWDSVEGYINDLSDRISRAEKDVIRYSWLRKKADQNSNNEIAVTLNIGHDWIVVKDLDAAIDHAIESEEP